MKLTNYEDSEDFTVDTAVHAMMGDYDHVSATLPSGHVVTIFADKIYVRDPGVRGLDGHQIWTVHAGIEPLEPCPECGKPVGRTRSGKIRRHDTVLVHGSGLREYLTCIGSGTVTVATPTEKETE